MLFFLSFISFLLQNLRTGGWSRSCGGKGRGGSTSGRGQVAGKQVGGLIQCKNCVHIYVNAKMIPVETVP
jgi:hypothetical protein